jgi:hypothetical protein
MIESILSLFINLFSLLGLLIGLIRITGYNGGGSKCIDSLGRMKGRKKNDWLKRLNTCGIGKKNGGFI